MTWYFSLATLKTLCCVLLCFSYNMRFSCSSLFRVWMPLGLVLVFLFPTCGNFLLWLSKNHFYAFRIVFSCAQNSQVQSLNNAVRILEFLYLLSDFPLSLLGCSSYSILSSDTDILSSLWSILLVRLSTEHFIWLHFSLLAFQISSSLVFSSVY